MDLYHSSIPAIRAPNPFFRGIDYFFTFQTFVRHKNHSVTDSVVGEYAPPANLELHLLHFHIPADNLFKDLFLQEGQT